MSRLTFKPFETLEPKGVVSWKNARERINQARRAKLFHLAAGMPGEDHLDSLMANMAHLYDMRSIGKTNITSAFATHTLTVELEQHAFSQRGRPIKGRFKIGKWELCVYCGQDTRSVLTDADIHAHMACDATSAWQLDARPAMNRHERRHRGVPRPPISEERARDIQYADAYYDSDEGWPVESPEESAYLDGEDD